MSTKKPPSPQPKGAHTPAGGKLYCLSGPEGFLNVSRSVGPDWASHTNYIGCFPTELAKLISAAPDLLELAQRQNAVILRLMDALERTAQRLPIRDLDECMEDGRLTALAGQGAITKATGGNKS